ncbi:MAG: EamA family transporter [Ilumatobacteraceae bacterium]
MEIVLAAGAAVVWGFGDFCGGRATRRMSPTAVTFAGQVLSLLPLALALLVLGDPLAGASSWAWGLLAGVGGFVGIALLYYCLANGSMSVVAPITAVVSAVVPLAVGVALGERPGALAVVGILVALAAITLVTGSAGSNSSATPSRIIVLAVVSGASIGTSLAALDRAADDSGMWPLLAMRVMSISLAGFLLVGRGIGRGADAGLGFGGEPGVGLLRRIPKWALLAGLFDMSANILFVAATREGMLSLVAVTSSLYPASTIILAMRFDRERVTRVQTTGILCAGVALVLVALGR